MTQDTTVPGSPEPGPDTFNFEDYLEGISTFPVFDHTAYLDQRSGAELGKVFEEIEGILGEQADLDKRIERRLQQSANSFVDAALDDMQEQRVELEKRLKDLLDQRDVLNEKIKTSALVLTFQVKTPEELGTVSREATRQFHKENTKYHKNASEDDLDYMTARSRYMLTAQIAHFCTGMRLSDGRQVPPPTRQGANKLLGSLISSEMMRLMESVSTGLSASQEWASKLDAGFPGRGPDMEDVSLGPDGSEGGEVVGLAPVDDADREALGVDRRTEPEARDGDDDPRRGELQELRHTGLDRDVDE